MWSIYSQTRAAEPALTECNELLERFPNAGTHSSTNYIFVGSHPDAVSPLIVGDLVDEDGEPLTLDLKVGAIAKELIRPVRDRAVHLTKAEASQLHGHPVWRIWINPYDGDRAAFQADYESVKALYESRPRDGDLVIPAFSNSTTVENAAAMLAAGIGNL